MKILSNFELPLWLTCNKIDMKVVISIKYRWNTFIWAKIRQMTHFVQDLLGVKIHTSCKILKLCQHFGVTKNNVGKKNFGI